MPTSISALTNTEVLDVLGSVTRDELLCVDGGMSPVTALSVTELVESVLAFRRVAREDAERIVTGESVWGQLAQPASEDNETQAAYRRLVGIEVAGLQLG